MATTAPDTHTLQPIAIVGIATEFPSGESAATNLNHREFFKFLLNKGESYEKIPADRFNIDAWKGKNAGQVLPERGSFLKDLSLFDAVEFGITTKDARAMAVSTRKLIELAFLSLLDSGIEYRARNVGCFMSGVAFDLMNIADPDEFEARGSFAGYPYMVANKVSYHLDLLGPSIPTDNACSSSLTALHLAVQALRSGDCESAVVGGCQLNHRFVDFVQYSQGSVLSPDGKCKPFDASADGFSRGEGAAVIVLKPLDAAIRDGDKIYASVLGTGINSAGSAAPVSAPVAEAQENAMHRAYRGTGRLPTEVDFVELHATGTAAGDPTEANWVGSQFSREDELLIGSVKGNIGHLEIAAFLASLSKVLSIFETRVIPPNVNLNRPNPGIKWKDYRMRVPTDATPLPARNPSGRSLVSMTSSGIGGTNGHVVLESPPTVEEIFNGDRVAGPVLLVAGGLSPRSATAIAEDFGNLRVDPQELPVLSNIYGRRLRQMTWRTFSILSPEGIPKPFAEPRSSPRVKPPVVFVFSGQGPQHFQMGRQLFKFYPVFRQSVLRMDETYRSMTGYSLIQHTGLFDDVSSPAFTLPEVWPIAITLPAIAIVQMATFDLLQSVGVMPDVIVGHSAGETALLYASGAVCQDMALEIAIARGQALTLSEHQGTMAALACSPRDAQLIIDSVVSENSTGVLEIACYNTPEAVTLSGTEELIDLAVDVATDRGFFARKLRTHTPIHSGLMESCSKDYHDRVGAIFSNYKYDLSPKITTYSTLTGERWTQPFTADYFWDTTRLPVMFTPAILSIVKQFPNATFLEISPHPVLSSYLSAMGAAPSSVLCTMRRSKVVKPFAEVTVFLEAIGSLAVLGYNRVNFQALNANHTLTSKASLPSYPFMRKDVPYYPEDSFSVRKQLQDRNGPLNYSNMRLNALTHPILAQHIIQGEPIMPAAGYLEMILELGAQTLWNVEFISMMPLLESKLLRVEVAVQDHKWTVRSWPTSQHDLQQNSGRIHAQGFFGLEGFQDTFAALDLDEVRKRCDVDVDVSGFYDSLNHFAQYGPSYRRVIAYYKGENEALLKIRGPDVDIHDANNYMFHPAILDACIHVIVHPSFTAAAYKGIYYLPSRVDSIVHHRSAKTPLPQILFAHAVFREWRPKTIVSDVVITDSSGSRICTLLGFEVAQHQATSMSDPASTSKSYDIVYQPLGAPPREAATVSKLETSEPGVYGVLDKLAAIKNVHEISTAANAEILQEEHLNILRLISSSSDSTISEPVPSLFRGALRQFEEVLDSVVKSSATSIGKKVIRVLSLEAGVPFLTDKIQSVLSQNDVYVELVASTFSADSAGALPSSVSRKVTYDLNTPPEEHGLTPSYFDIIVGFHCLGLVDDVSKSLSFLGTLLTPGGTLIFGDLDGDAWEQARSGTQWIDFVHSYSPEAQQARRSLPAWLGALKEAHFRQVNSHVDDSANPLFVTIEAQKSSVSLIPIPKSKELRETVVQFRLETVMELQKQLADIGDGTLWLQTTEHSIEAAAARGFSRALRREMVTGSLRLVVFNEIFDDEDRTKIISRLSEMPNLENELTVACDGTILVPRLVPSSSPKIARPFDSASYWALRDSGEVVQQPLPSVPPHHVLVRIAEASPLEAGMRGVSGYIHDAGSTPWSKNEAIVAVVCGELSNYAVVHEGQIAKLYDVDKMKHYASIALPLFIIAAAIDRNTLRYPRRLGEREILVTDADSPFPRMIVLLLEKLGIRTRQIEKHVSLDTLAVVTKSKFILSGYTNQGDIQVLRSAINSSVPVFFWNDPDHGARHALSANPWAVSDTMSDLLHLLPNLETPVLALDPKKYVPTASLGSVKKQSFDSHKAYLLVGGIGSFGLQIALWMYEKGAREIILTSRSGRASLKKAGNTAGLRILGYLESLPDLHIRLESCDASSREAMSDLVAQTRSPIGGCILLSVVLSDRLFASHTAESFHVPYPSKTGAFHALQKAVDIPSLDFLVAVSSAATFGSVGQTNYASANTTVEALLQQYPNAFSLVAPAILDTTTIADNNSTLMQWLPWAMTSSQLCDCIEDGILKLEHGRFGLYVPDLDWNEVQQHFGSSTLYDHLVKHSGNEEVVDASADPAVILRDIVLRFLDVSPDDFSPLVAFTSYGLDSLSAGRLSFALKPILEISQLQLLADVSLNDLLQKIQDKPAAVAASAAVDDTKRFNWAKINQAGETIVKLVDVEGNPLIIVHGASGNIIAFMTLQEQFKSALWAIQTTPETPLDSIHSQAAFYFQQIKAAKPVGPYRLAGFSASCLVTLELARLFEANGDTLLQLVMLDHFPTLFALPSQFEVDEATIRENQVSRATVWRALSAMNECYRRDATAARGKMADELTDAYNGLAVSDYIRDTYAVFEQVVATIAKFLIEIAVFDGKMEQDKIRDLLSEWYGGLKAPLTLYVATRGMAPSIPASLRDEWADLGSRGYVSNMKVVTVDADHFDLLGKDEVIRGLQEDWSKRP